LYEGKKNEDSGSDLRLTTIVTNLACSTPFSTIDAPIFETVYAGECRGTLLTAVEQVNPLWK